LDEQHYFPTFIANNIEELRKNGEMRKAMKQYKEIMEGKQQPQAYA